jgi:hypothetical protein
MVTVSWRAFRRATRRANQLSAYLEDEATRIEQLSARLNQHGFELEHTMSEVGPKLEMIAGALRQPLVAAALPWVLRRLMARPYRRRH